jgi:hypothetical protein
MSSYDVLKLYDTTCQRLQAMEQQLCPDRSKAACSVSRSEMAAIALQENRHELATLLLDDEPSPAGVCVCVCVCVCVL